MIKGSGFKISFFFLIIILQSIGLAKNFYHVVAVEPDVESLISLHADLEASGCSNASICKKPVSRNSEPFIDVIDPQNILFIGMGYAGVVSGACLANVGHYVIGLDIDCEKIEKLEKGIISIREKGLEELVKKNIQAKTLRFSTDYAEVNSTDACFICVDTPAIPGGGVDLSRVLAVAKSIATYMNKNQLVVIKSTVPPGTDTIVRNAMEKTLKERGRSDLNVEIAANPEFLREGTAVDDFNNPDRVVIGIEKDGLGRSILEKIYAPFKLEPKRFCVMDLPSAFMTKMVANAMLIARLSLVFEMGNLCAAAGADGNQVLKAVGLDPRVGKHYMKLGPGVGGACLPKDLKNLRSFAETVGISTPVLDATEKVNDHQKRIIGEKILRYFEGKGGLAGKTVAILGLAFKAETDDTRDTPAYVLIQQMLENGAVLRLYDPAAMKNAQLELKDKIGIIWCENALEAVEKADAIALMTEWNQFKSLDLTKTLSKMTGKGFFDGRNLLDRDEMKRLGFDYFCIGYGE